MYDLSSSKKAITRKWLQVDPPTKNLYYIKLNKFWGKKWGPT